ncbi:MAG: adenosylcobalamin-dependent ribonucleoside-diphosphate reductase [Thermodesulfobacteriota bacterium]|nr:adenosylcobalamin-dependent ribonucleoside-diphosphate reductase [Thermodesulfobacteriota bacterium]
MEDQHNLGLGINAIKVLERRYLLLDEAGNIDETPARLFRRVARAIAAVETHFNPEADVNATEEAFYTMMAGRDFLPNSPTLMNAGTPLGQLSACFVLPVEDTIADIFDTLKHMAAIHQSGGGTGFTFTHLRPCGDVVRSTNGVASGPVSFMEIFNTATDVIKQGGKRRGANMGILRVDHPDILRFIRAKANGGLTNFNLSVGVTDEFMEAAAKGKNIPLINPRNNQQTGPLPARDIFDAIVESAWHTGDPGMLFLDRINRDNPTPALGPLEATNPCGELPLLPYESCNLGSINLARMVSDGAIDWEKLGRVVHTAVRFLDNVITANVLPLPAIDEITRANRKIGLGVMGFADALILMGQPYDSGQALETADALMGFIRNRAQAASARLAAERKPFPNFPSSIHASPGEAPLRNASLLSIAPTGTISIIAGCSSGIEPLFALAYVRNVMEGTRLMEVHPLFEQIARQQGVWSEALKEKIARQGTLNGIAGIPENLRRLFATDWDIDPAWHIRMQAVFQQHTDNSVSKTINLPAEADAESIRRAYIDAHRQGCKGITVYRYGSKAGQVLNMPGQEPAGAGPSQYVSVQSAYAGGCASGGCEI